MIIVLSPAKRMKVSNTPVINDFSLPEYYGTANSIVSKLRKLSIEEISKLLKVSHKLAAENYDRYQNWSEDPRKGMSNQALFAFHGDVYLGLQAESLNKAEVEFAHDHLRILSGLYGLLRPLDLVQPYRLEMGTPLTVGGNKNLYALWKDKITGSLNKLCNETGIQYLVNLASDEYFKAIDPQKLTVKVIKPVFKDFRNGEYKVVSVFAKKARGMMSRYIIQNRLTEPEDIKSFDEDGYFFNDRMSDGNELVFTREA